MTPFDLFLMYAEAALSAATLAVLAWRWWRERRGSLIQRSGPDRSVARGLHGTNHPSVLVDIPRRVAHPALEDRRTDDPKTATGLDPE